MTTENIKGSAVLSIGRIYCDLIFTGVSGLPVLGREIFADALDIAAGGGAYIAAAHLVHAGRQVELVARLGTDALSLGVETQLQASGVGLQFLERAADAGPQVTVATVLGHERAFLSRRAGSALPSTLETAIAWPKATHLHIAEYATLAEIPALVSMAKSHGLTVSLDPSWDETLIYDPALLETCRGVDIFLPNMEEAAAITGKTDAREAILALSAHFPVVALKAGGDGALLCANGDVVDMPARDVRVVDTTGAGDAFNAGFIDAWLYGKPSNACLEAGIVAGSLAVQAPGGAAVLNCHP
jgi:sugar/nucleoside kinase (ribokinase family)